MSAWQMLPTLALAIDAEIAPARAQAVTAALLRRIVPLLAARAGRFEPLASGCLYEHGGRLILMTCRHVFDDGAAIGDLAVPLAAAGRLLPLRHARARLLAHPQHDLAALEIGAEGARKVLQRGWQPVPLAALPTEVVGSQFVLAGYPYAQMRRCDGTLYAKPLVVFARRLEDEAAPRVRYGYTAVRVDGQLVYAPALDGVSGATLWSVTEARGEVDCVLQPAGVQSAFLHSRYARGAPIAAAGELLARLGR
jgi:hypothetical protein